MAKPIDPADEFFNDAWLDRRQLLLGAAAAGGGLLSAIAACPALANEKRGGVLRYGFGDTNAGEQMDPATVQNGASIELMHVIFEPLVRRGKDWKFSPWLAESYELDRDKNIWTFHLRKGVKFHDGSPLTAKDVIYSLGRLVDEKVGASLRSRLKGSFNAGSLEAVDEHTVRIHMLRRDTMLDQPLSRYNTGIIKAGTVPTADPKTAIGTGPFKIKSFEPGQSWQVERFAGYWQPGVPLLDGIQCINIPDQSAKVQSVISGAVDLIDPVDSVLVKQLAANPKVRVEPLPSAMSWCIFLDQKVKPFDDVRVRRAIKLAVDRKLILDTVYQGLGVITPDVPLPPGDPMFPTDLGDGAQDIPGAKKLLAEAGFPNGLEFTLYTSPILPGMVDLAVTFAESVKAAGIRVTVNQWPAATYWDQVWIKYPTYVDYNYRRNAHDALDLVFAKGTPYADGVNFDQDGKLREFIDKALVESDPAKQVEMYKDALRRVALESGVIIPCFLSRNFTLNKNARGELFKWEMPISYYLLSKDA
ncbi:ABC transporter substrate-binding protein [Terrarubrum flagellatum]|uniref:ABC transporter substrate-binding protein n=1 Tax=Terrirubrum flagellatum TaxID=2895980 RepID=UPI00314532EC